MNSIAKGLQLEASRNTQGLRPSTLSPQKPPQAHGSSNCTSEQRTREDMVLPIRAERLEQAMIP